MYKEELLTVESYRSKEDHVAFVMKIIAIAASIYGMCRSFSGWMFFTYFTNLSNIFVDIVLLVFAGFNWNRIRKDGKCPPVANGWYIIKFMATISITLTFLIYLLVLCANRSKRISWCLYGEWIWQFMCAFCLPGFSNTGFLFV